jgi:peptide/nickel transport system permease protein
MSIAVEAAAPATAQAVPNRLIRAWRFVSSDAGLLAGLIVLVILVLAAIVGPDLIHANAYKTTSDELLSPSGQHWFGTDDVGRDIFIRVLLALRYSLVVMALSTLGTLIIGVTLGLLCGYLGGAIDWAALRVTDILLAIPSLMIAIAAIASFGAKIQVLIFVLIVSFVSIAFRVARTAAIQLRQRDYVLAARLSNVGRFKILLTHILPNSRGTLMVQTTLTAALVLLIETSLSFLGLGAQPPTPSLGSMIANGSQYMEVSPHIILFPTVFVVVLIGAVTSVGNGIQRVFAKQSSR